MLPAVAWDWWQNRRPVTLHAPPAEGVAPHLRQALTVGETRSRRILPIDSVATVLVLAVLGAAGPIWTRQVDPFLAQSGPLVVVLKVTPSMTTLDVASTRLDRAKFKVRELLDLRAGARMTLAAYAGTAHRVLLFTEDTAIIRPYLGGLEPDVMPVARTNASADLAALGAAQDQSLAVHMVAGPDVRDPGVDQLGSVPVVRISANNGDIRQLDYLLNAVCRCAMLEEGDPPWGGRSWWLAFPPLIGVLWFRRGSTMRRGAIVLAQSLGVVAPAPARAEGIANWFLTPDQQGQRAFRQKNTRGRQRRSKTRCGRGTRSTGPGNTPRRSRF